MIQLKYLQLNPQAQTDQKINSCIRKWMNLINCQAVIFAKYTHSHISCVTLYITEEI